MAGTAVLDQAETAARCGNSACGKRRPPGATARWRFCSATCRQAGHRARLSAAPSSPRVDAAELDQLDTEIGDAIDVLVAAAELARPGDVGEHPRTGFVQGVGALAEHLIAAAVARDRAAGLSWDDVGEWLEIHPDTARRRYGSAAARVLRQARRMVP